MIIQGMINIYIPHYILIATPPPSLPTSWRANPISSFQARPILMGVLSTIQNHGFHIPPWMQVGMWH